MEDSEGATDRTTSTSQVVPGYDEVSTFCQDALRKTLLATKHANDLPSSEEDFEYYSSFKGFREIMKTEAKKIVNLMTQLLKHQHIKVNLGNLNVEEKFEKLSDCNDTILERIGIAIDEASGKRKTQTEMLTLATVNSQDLIATSWNRKINITNQNKGKPGNNACRLFAAKNILRPQLKFKDKIDNSNDPFVPIIKEKPNSIRPLSVILEPTENGILFSHPYQCELDHFTPAEEFLKPAELQQPTNLEETPLIFVDTPEKVESLLNDLKQVKEIAVDLEHHSYRSFQGITCLMQISTRDKDYIVDTLELRSDLQPLNEVFTDPKIVKVLHGANMDIDWLQRDLGLYIVNMFDTGQASRVLNMAQYSLSYLLKYHFRHEVDKQFQLADWRIRPLPAEMTLYAREDTHYLLHVYDRMKNQLLEQGNDQANLLMSVFQRSTAICLKRYEKPVFHENLHLELLKKSRKVFNARQTFAFQQLYRWRDHIARVEDESTGYILPNHMLIKIAEVLPREQQGILACCNPVPPLVRQNLNELHDVVWRARENAIPTTTTQELQVQVAHTEQQINIDDPLRCPHDSVETDDGTGAFAERQPGELLVSVKVHVKEEPSISIFGTSEVPSPQKAEKLLKVQKILKEFKTPFNQYCEILVENEMLEEEAGDDEAQSPECEMETSEKQSPSSTNDSPAQSKGTKRSLHEAEEEEEEEEATIREQLQPRKNKKKERQQNAADKIKQTMESNNNFQAFDYSTVNYKEFSGGKKSGKKRRQRKAFDADNQSQQGFGHTKKRKQAGGKSLTFGRMQSRQRGK